MVSALILYCETQQPQPIAPLDGLTTASIFARFMAVETKSY